MSSHLSASIKRKCTEIIPNTIMSAARDFCLVLKNEFEIAVVNEP